MSYGLSGSRSSHTGSRTEQASQASRRSAVRFFGGLEGAEIAEVLGVSEITVKRDWKVARLDARS